MQISLQVGNSQTTTNNLVIENNNLYNGHITRYYSDRHFGFVETQDENSFFFFFDKTEQKQLKKQGLIDKIHKFCSGEEVEFKLRPSRKSTYKLEAYDLKFIKNERREQLINEAYQSDYLLGYIKLIDNGKLFVKHISTYVFVPLVISNWEKNLDEVYYNRVEQLVKFRLTQTQKIDKLSAALTDTKFIDVYYELNSAKDNETILSANITGKNSDGLFVTLLNGQVDGFAPKSKNPSTLELLKFEKLRKGNNTDMKIKSILNNKKVLLTLVDIE